MDVYPVQLPPRLDQGPAHGRQRGDHVHYDGTGTLTGVTNPLNQTIAVTRHLPGGLPETVQDPNGVTTSLKIVHTPDALGSPTRTDVLDSVGGIAQQRSATFDALGRLLQDVGGVGQTTVHAYDSAGNAVRTTDALGRTMLRSFDALGRLIAITDPAGGITTIGYDATDRPVSLTDAKGVTTTFVYDGFGDVIQRVSPDWPVRPRRRRSRDQPELPSLLDPRPATAGERTHSSSFSM